MPKHTKPQLVGFTLMETLLYIAIFTIIATSIISVTILIYRFKVVVEDRVGVDEDIRVLTESIRSDMYRGRSVEVTPQGVLLITDAVGNEIRYYLDSAQVYRKYQSEAALSVTSNQSQVLEFSIADLSTPDSAGTIQIVLDIMNYPVGQIKPEVRETITSTISLKFI